LSNVVSWCSVNVDSFGPSVERTRTVRGEREEGRGREKRKGRERVRDSETSKITAVVNFVTPPSKRRLNLTRQKENAQQKEGRRRRKEQGGVRLPSHLCGLA